jgi:hypothetical protein
MLFVKLLKSNARPQAMQLLKQNVQMFTPYEDLELHLKDEDLFDSDLQAYYNQAFI